jgi:hypothetical protein
MKLRAETEDEIRMKSDKEQTIGKGTLAPGIMSISLFS